MNTSGGGLSYTHPGMYGSFLLVEAVRQLRGGVRKPPSETQERSQPESQDSYSQWYRRQPVLNWDSGPGNRVIGRSHLIPRNSQLHP